MNKADYDIKFMRTHTKQFRLQLNIEKDKDVISYLESKTNVNGFLKALIRKEIEHEKKE